MDLYEDRLRALLLCIKLGGRIGLPIRQPECPTKNALKTWYLDYEQSHEMRVGCTQPTKFSRGRKERAVRHCLEHYAHVQAEMDKLQARLKLSVLKDQKTGFSGTNALELHKPPPQEATGQWLKPLTR